MPKRFYKFKLLLDENMPPRQRFPRLNSRFDLKHMRDDFSQIGVKDPAVHDLAAKQNRLIITFNGKNFKKLVGKSTQTGVINVSANLRYEQIDTKFTALLTKSSEKSHIPSDLVVMREVSAGKSNVPLIFRIYPLASDKTRRKNISIILIR